jgi:hypothetical protein
MVASKSSDAIFDLASPPNSGWRSVDICNLDPQHRGRERTLSFVHSTTQVARFACEVIQSDGHHLTAII